MVYNRSHAYLKQLSSDLNELGEQFDNEDLIEASQRPHLMLTDSEIRAEFLRVDTAILKAAENTYRIPPPGARPEQDHEPDPEREGGDDDEFCCDLYLKNGEQCQGRFRTRQVLLQHQRAAMHRDPVAPGRPAAALVRSNQCCNCDSVSMNRKAALRHLVASLKNNRCSERTRGSIIPREIEMQIPMKCCICDKNIRDITKAQTHLREHLPHEFARRERAEEDTGGSKCRRVLQAGEKSCGRKHESAEALREHHEEKTPRTTTSTR